MANETLRVKKQEHTSEAPETVVVEVGDEPEDTMPIKETVDDAFQDVLWPPRVGDDLEIRCLDQFHVWDSATQAVLMNDVHCVAVDVAADLPTLGEDGPGTLGGALVVVTAVLEQQESPHPPDEIATVEKRLQRKLMDSLTGSLTMRGATLTALLASMFF